MAKTIADEMDAREVQLIESMTTGCYRRATSYMYVLVVACGALLRRTAPFFSSLLSMYSVCIEAVERRLQNDRTSIPGCLVFTTSALLANWCA